MRPLMRAIRHRRRDERGVMAIVISLLTCFTLLPIAAIAVDLGVQRVARRDLQNIADLVALDLARGINGQPYSQLITNLQSDADKSAARSTVAGDAPFVTPQLGIVNPALWSPSDPDPAGYFTPVNSDADGIPNAVRVFASTTVHFNFVPGTGGAGRDGAAGGVGSSSIAFAQDSACYSLGSFAARVSTSGSVLNGLLSDALDLGAIDYRGLAWSSIKLDDLAAELNAGTPAELMSTSVTLNQLFTAMAHVFQNNGTTSGSGSSSANLTLLNSLAAASYSSVTNASFTLDKLFSLSTGDGSVAATTVNVYDLVAATAFVANGTNFLAIPSFSAMGGVVTGNLKVIEKPVVACGPVGTTADTSQIDLQLSVHLLATSVLGLLNTDSTLNITAKVGQATGTLSSITCKTGYPTGIDVGVTSALAQLSTSLHVSVKSLLNAVIATVDTGSGGTMSGSSSTVSIMVPPDSYGSPKETGATPAESQVANITSGNVVLLGVLPLGVTMSTLVSAINSNVINATVNPLLVSLNNNVITPLSQALGIRLGGADVTLPQAPDCGQVALAG
jgi:uncharacterized membrane protein